MTKTILIAGKELRCRIRGQAQADALAERGYRVLEDPQWDKDFGAVGGILRGDDGKLLAGADPREETTAAAR